MSTSIDLGVRGPCVSSAASPPGSFSGLVSSSRKQGFTFGCWEEIRLNGTSLT